MFHKAPHPANGTHLPSACTDFAASGRLSMVQNKEYRLEAVHPFLGEYISGPEVTNIFRLGVRFVSRNEARYVNDNHRGSGQCSKASEHWPLS
jgi:hypothetical protein